MSFVLAIEPDSPQADPLRAAVCAHAGAELIIVGSAYAAIVTMNQRLPDLVLIGRAVSPQQRTQITTHLRSLNAAAVPTLNIPPLVHATLDPANRDAPADAEDEPRKANVDLFVQEIEHVLAAMDATIENELP